MRKTVQILSDDVHLYWLWLEKNSDPARKEVSCQENKRVDLFLQELELNFSQSEMIVSPCHEAVVVTKREEPSSLSSPLPVRRSPTSPTVQNTSDGMFEANYCIILLVR